MTLDETKQLLHKISANYIYAFSNKTIDEKKEILMNWYNNLINYDFETINNKLDKYMVSNKYAPTIADLIANQTSKFSNYNTSEKLSAYDLQVLEHNMKKYGHYLDYSFEELKKHFDEVKENDNK